MTAKALCPRCASIFSGTLKFCPHDGSRLQVEGEATPLPTRRCPTCDTKYEMGRFCVRDGALLELLTSA